MVVDEKRGKRAEEREEIFFFFLDTLWVIAAFNIILTPTGILGVYFQLLHST